MHEEGSESGITRVPKACDPCRLRKTRCDIATQAVCSECLKRDQAISCTTRDKARPNRSVKPKPTRPKVGEKRPRSPSVGDASVTSDSQVFESNPTEPTRHVSFLPRPKASTPSPRPASGSRTVESIIVEDAQEKFGLTLDVSLPPKNIFESVTTTRHSLHEIGLVPGDPQAVRQAQLWINTHFQAIHYNTPFLNISEVLETANEVFSTPAHPQVGHDRLGLLYAILALGSLREQTYDAHSKRYRSYNSAIDETMSPMSSTSLTSYRSRSTALFLFRLAADELEALDQPSEVAVQALFVLHTFISNTSMGRRSRDYVARAIMMAHELGLNRKIPSDIDPGARIDKRALRRRAMLYLHVYFSDVYLSALDSHPPLIKRQDYDPEVFDVVYQQSSSGVDTPSGTPLDGLKAFVDLVTTIGSILERLHVNTLSASSRIELILRLDSEIDNLRERLGALTFGVDLSDSSSVDLVKRNASAGAILRQIHYNWSRIALRAPFLRDPMLRHSSLSICARSAMTILTLHRHVISSALLNLPWMQLSRVTTSVYIVFIAHWRGEVTASECENAVNCTLELLRVIGTRWDSASKVEHTVVQLAEKTGLACQTQEPHLDTDLAQLAAVATSAANGEPTAPVWTASQPESLDPLGQLFDLDIIRQLDSDFGNLVNDPDPNEWPYSMHCPPW